ncbi:unnamed protein product [Psylliodes chrysocephalus]|uniref:DUF4371 domain-containing protein n=1 Tax=Psylliodes chrysocephalus TaxID=3402493 RepID=A0A9P0GMW2_9CUCU|nr:unnamed protein product [Psylliodes chrysocephala]
MTTGKVRCRACNLEFTAELTVIKNHAKSLKHALKVKALPNTTITAMFNKPETSLQTQSKIAEIKITGFLTEHNISFNSAEHLTSLIKSCFPDSKIAQGMSLGRTKAAQISKNEIGACAEEEIITYLKCNKFRLIIDESTDISSVKTMCICVRFFHPKVCRVQTLFWKLLQMFPVMNQRKQIKVLLAKGYMKKYLKLFISVHRFHQKTNK